MRKKFIIFVTVCLIFCFAGTVFADDIGPDLTKYGGHYTHRVRGPKSLIWGKATNNVTPAELLDYVEGMNKILGRTEYLVLEMDRRGFELVLVADEDNIYDVPEWSHLAATNDDGYSRICIPATVENPILVTRVSDVTRTRGPGQNPDRLEFLYHFAKLFLEMGVKAGAIKTPLSPGDDRDTFNYYKHLRAAYENAQANNLWPGTRMIESIEEYFAEGTMVWYEAKPESVGGVWTKDAGPVSTRKEMREYDRMLYDCFVEIYGEWEYFTNNRNPLPWYMNSQSNRYGIDGAELPAISIAEATLMADRTVTVRFNRAPHKNFEPYPTGGRGLRDSGTYRITWTKPDGTVVIADNPNVQKFMFNTVRLQLPTSMSGANGLYDGYIGSQFMGFEEQELADLRADAKYAYLKRDTALNASPTAIKRGEYIDASRMANSINGTLTVEILEDVMDWSGNMLTNKTATVSVKPWLSQVYRAPNTGVYVYAGTTVMRETMELMAGYIDEVFSNPEYGHRLANTFIRDNRGSQLVSYGVHPGEHPGYGQGTNPASEQGGLYVEGWGGAIAQGTESGVWRNKRVTRYRNEFVALHEMGHSTQSAFNRYNGWADLSADGLNPMNRGLSVRALNTAIWREELAKGKFEATYFGGWVNNVNNNNDGETISTGNTFWFTIMRESTDGTNNGTWGPINTRNELLRYSPTWFEFFKTLYYNGTSTDNETISWEKNFIGTPWESYKVSSIYDIDGSQFAWSMPEAMPDGTPEGVFRTVDVVARVSEDIPTIAHDTGLAADSFVPANLNVVVKPEVVTATAEASGLQVEAVNSLPVTHGIFALKGGNAGEEPGIPYIGDVMAYAVDVTGSELLATDAANVRLMAVKSGSFFTHVSRPEQYVDGTFTILDANGNAVSGALSEDGQYRLFVLVKDGGLFDADSESDAVVVGAFATVKAANPVVPPVIPSDDEKPGGGSGGCSAGNYLFALAALLPLLARKKNS